ncbi:MAG: HAMP domain-containing sensor histidine kinase [Verrucomicrobiales bacterium]
MSLRTKLTLLFAAMLGACLVLTAGLSWWELVAEPEAGEEEHEPVWWRLTEIVLRGSVPAALMALAAWAALRRMLKPVEALTTAAERISASDFGDPLPETGRRDELGRLTAVFNRMTARLRTSFDHIREFTLHASHELKTPLTVLRATFERDLARPDLAAAEREETAARLDEVDRLTHIVDSLSLLTKADARMLSLDRRDVDLADLMRDALEDAGALAEGNQIAVELAECAAGCQTHADPHRLRQVLLILVDNAVKYNRAGGWVRLALRSQSGSALLDIANSGAGISEKDQQRIFDRFYRGSPGASESETERAEGCGLGLSIASRLAEAQGQRLELVRSTDHETVFRLTVPIRPSAQGAQGSGS